MNKARNADEEVVSGFGAEWSRFSQEELDQGDLTAVFQAYFSVFPWHALPANAVGADIGCGSGRWAALVAPRVGTLHCVDASPAALAVAKRNLRDSRNAVFHEASVGDLPFAPGSLDFAYSLGVLHHVPDTAAAIQAVVQCLKPGAPLLLYLYYALENRPTWFRALWRATDVVRSGIARLPNAAKNVVCDALALTVYWPLARTGRGLERLGVMPAAWPLAAYRDRSFYMMRTDSLDRFGTRLEQRFTRAQIARMMEAAGLENITFRDESPYWCAVGLRGAD
jgi:SAM-dependent methyltransferase